MSVLHIVLMAVPVVFLMASVVIATKAVSRGKSRKRSLLVQLAAFGAVFALCLIFPLAAGAASDTTAVDVAKANASGIAYMAAGLTTGLSCIGGGIAVGNAAPAAIGATSEDPKAFGKAIIFVALGEGIALYGMLISMMIISNIG